MIFRFDQPDDALKVLTADGLKVIEGRRLYTM
jgi:hypothetical protein